MDFSDFLRDFQRLPSNYNLDDIQRYAIDQGFTTFSDDDRQITHEDGSTTTHSNLIVIARSGLDINNIRGGIGFIVFYSVIVTRRNPHRTMVNTHLADYLFIPNPSRKRLRGQGMYDEIPLFPHHLAGEYYRDNVGQLFDKYGNPLKENDGIAFDKDDNVIGYDVKVYPTAPTSEQIQQSLINLTTDREQSIYDFITNYEEFKPMRIPRTRRRAIGSFATRWSPTRWSKYESDADEYIRKYTGLGS